jgi:hypothetical protein
MLSSLQRVLNLELVRLPLCPALSAGLVVCCRRGRRWAAAVSNSCSAVMRYTRHFGGHAQKSQECWHPRSGRVQ